MICVIGIGDIKVKRKINLIVWLITSSKKNRKHVFFQLTCSQPMSFFKCLAVDASFLLCLDLINNVVDLL